MATINHNPIYKSLNANLSYVSEAHKQIPVSDLTTVMEYVSGEHAEVLYTQGYHCSCNPELAAEEFLDDREKYLKNKNGKKLSGQVEGKEEIIAHHIYVSFHKEDFVSVEKMMKITDKLIQRTAMKDFRSLRAPHVNTDEGHVHISLNAYSMDGKKKFCMNNKMLYALRRELDYICYEHGLSLIDDKTLLKTDEEYAKWFAEVKAEGKTRIHPNRTIQQKKEQQKKRNDKRKEQKSEKTYVKKLPLRNINTEIQEAAKYNFSEKFGKQVFYAADGRFLSPRTKVPYRLKMWTEDGRKRSTVELLFLLIAVVLFDTQKYAEEKNYYQPKINIDHEIQRMIDGISATREYGITDKKVLESTIKECGSNISSLKRAIYQIDKALRDRKDEGLEEKRKKYEKKLKEYNRQYYKLMQVKVLTKEVMTAAYRENIYTVKPIEQSRKIDLDDIISNAKSKKKMDTRIDRQKNLSREELDR